MVANGPEGSVRGEMVVPLPGTSDEPARPAPVPYLQGPRHKLSACRYYASIGAAARLRCAGQPAGPDHARRLEARKQVQALRQRQRRSLGDLHQPDGPEPGPPHVRDADGADHIAFVVCNHPGPDGSSQREVDSVIDVGLEDQKRVACVAMEWRPSPGVNGGRPFTKFLTFGPDGALMPSINLDGRGEKYMPGACVACHGGTQYNGPLRRQRQRRRRSSAPASCRSTPATTSSARGRGLSEVEQSQAIPRPQHAREGDRPVQHAIPSLSRLITAGIRAARRPCSTRTMFRRTGLAAEAGGSPEATKLYHEVVGGVCRTCHAAMGTDTRTKQFDWDSQFVRAADNVDALRISAAGPTTCPSMPRCRTR